MFHPFVTFFRNFQLEYSFVIMRCSRVFTYTFQLRTALKIIFKNQGINNACKLMTVQERY